MRGLVQKIAQYVVVVEARRRPRLPLAGDMDVIGLFAYMISPSMVLADVEVSACDFNE
jgi:hypothetical protein